MNLPTDPLSNAKYKKQILRNFNSASTSYELISSTQNQSAQILVSKLFKLYPNFYPTSILDLGAGTGYASQKLLSKFPASRYTLNDISEDMLMMAKNKFSNQKVCQLLPGDMEKIEIGSHDLIISNFAFQWLADISTSLSKFYSKSKILAFTTTLDGTFYQWDQLLSLHNLPPATNKFLAENELSHFLMALDPKTWYFETRNFDIEFKDARAFMIYLKQLGASASMTKLSAVNLKNIIKSQTQSFKMTYKVFFAILERQI
jgi:malonyl-CoA O-methyltransferase